MPNSYSILTADVRESNRLRNEYWIHAGANMIPVQGIRRHGLRGFPEDLFYTDAAMDALVEDAHAHGDIHGRIWPRWREVRHRFNVLPFAAWLHLNESSLEELSQRGIPGAAMLDIQYLIGAAELEAAHVDTLGRLRRKAAGAIRDQAVRRLVRIAPERIVVSDFQVENGDTMVTAHWAALPAAERKVPDWILNGLDNESRI